MERQQSSMARYILSASRLRILHYSLFECPYESNEVTAIHENTTPARPRVDKSAQRLEGLFVPSGCVACRKLAHPHEWLDRSRRIGGLIGAFQEKSSVGETATSKLARIVSLVRLAAPVVTLLLLDYLVWRASHRSPKAVLAHTGSRNTKVIVLSPSPLGSISRRPRKRQHMSNHISHRQCQSYGTRLLSTFDGELWYSLVLSEKLQQFIQAHSDSSWAV